MVVPLNPASEQECAQGPELLEQRSFSATLSLGVGDRGAFFLCKLIIFHISIVNSFYLFQANIVASDNRPEIATKQPVDIHSKNIFLKAEIFSSNIPVMHLLGFLVNLQI